MRTPSSRRTACGDAFLFHEHCEVYLDVERLPSMIARGLSASSGAEEPTYSLYELAANAHIARGGRGNLSAHQLKAAPDGLLQSCGHFGVGLEQACDSFASQQVNDAMRSRLRGRCVR